MPTRSWRHCSGCISFSWRTTSRGYIWRIPAVGGSCITSSIGNRYVAVSAAVRLLSLAVVIKVLQRAVGDTIRGRVIVYTACGAVLIVYAASLAILEIERQHPGAKIATFGDAVWWSITTVTTVGYGDLSPVTGMGRVVAVALMLAGISLVGIITATLASWIVQRVSQRGHRRDDRAYRRTSGRDPATREVGHRQRRQ